MEALLEAWLERAPLIGLQTTRVTDNVLASGYKPQSLGSEPARPNPAPRKSGPWVPREAGAPTSIRCWEALGHGRTSYNRRKNVLFQAGQRTMSTIIMLYFLT